MTSSSTIICKNFIAELNEFIEYQKPDGIFVLVDENTEKFCLPLLLQSEKLKNCQVITIPSGDENKNIHTAIEVWNYLSSHGATRRSLMINAGGGMVSDLGGFAAATFKRGISYINVSTTLLGAVDAATGGKTGINFMGLKNEIGVFAPADKVLINVDFFRTLDDKNLRSGFAEMIKHSLLDSREHWKNILKFNLDTIDYELLKHRVAESVKIKEQIVEKDPKEQNLRKALNLGHTFGHAFESFSYSQHQPVLHGYAVMYGLVCELYLSHVKLNFPKEDLLKLVTLAKENYGKISFCCDDYEQLYELMTHDKKNVSDTINFTLLSEVGKIELNQTATKKEIFECLDFYQEM
ncbi:MAG TPA: 3-dehydroquinate synthase [Paludibacteraceae bacterium]|nr:3-dehydroquinate synthase [Paludibacteraceae bacterium]